MSRQSKRRKKTSPIFGELAEKEDDQWWKSLLQELADGYFPHRVSYSDSKLMFKNKSGKHTCLHLDPSDKKLLNNIKTFFSETVGLTPSDQFDFDDFHEELGLLTFKELQSSVISRRIAIDNYLKKKKPAPDEYKFLRRLIWWGFVNKLWNEDTFVFEENRIIDFNPNEIGKKPAKRTTKKK